MWHIAAIKIPFLLLLLLRPDITAKADWAYNTKLLTCYYIIFDASAMTTNSSCRSGSECTQLIRRSRSHGNDDQMEEERGGRESLHSSQPSRRQPVLFYQLQVSFVALFGQGYVLICDSLEMSYDLQ